MNITKEQLLSTIANFSWDFCTLFHLETEFGNFEWSDPEYGGDNTITPCEPYKQWVKRINMPFARCKGKHIIRDYCGPDIVLKGI